MRKVVHFEIPAEDLSRAKAFYGETFGWRLDTMPMGDGDYTMVTTTPVDESSWRPTEAGSINGGLLQRSKEIPAPVITIDVDGIDDTLKAIEAAGGSTVTPRTPIPGTDRAVAYFMDTEGNVMGLFESGS